MSVDTFEPLTLFPIDEPAYEKGQTLDERFDAFQRANPHVAEALAHLARQYRAAGNQRVGIKACWERLRWEFAVQTGERRYVLNNSYTSRYARLLAERCPDLADAFETRELRS